MSNTTTETKLTKIELNVLSAWFARSNMGQRRAPRDQVQHLLQQDLTLASATVWLCGEFMESDEHERIFFVEARGWHRTFTREFPTREALLKTWPDVKEFFW